MLMATIREVLEETGIRVVLGRPLTPSLYQAGGRAKQVRYWAARSAESAGFVPSREVDQLTWLPADAARERLTYQRDVALLDELRSGPVRSAPFILLRHASAGRRSAAEDSGRDLARPLDARGSADARLLAGLLACYGQCRVISSAAERCLATVRPYAAVVGVPVEVEPAFTVPAAPMTPGDLLMAGVGHATGAGRKTARPEVADAGQPVSGGGPRDVSRLAALRATGLAASGVPTLICAHRENLSWLVDASFEALGAGRPADAPPLRKGAFWVLQSAGGVLVSSERHDVVA